MYNRKGVVSFAVVREPRGNQTGVVFSISEVRMGWKTDPKQTAPSVVRGIDQTCGDLPVHVLSLPGAATDQDHRYGGVSNVIVTDSTSDLVLGKALIKYVAGIDRLVHHVVAHHSDEPVLVVLVFLVVVADEYLPSSRSSHLSPRVAHSGTAIRSHVAQPVRRMFRTATPGSHGSEHEAVQCPGSRDDRTSEEQSIGHCRPL